MRDCKPPSPPPSPSSYDRFYNISFPTWPARSENPHGLVISPSAPDFGGSRSSTPVFQSLPSVLGTETKTWTSIGRNMADTSPHPDIYESIAPALIAYSIICQVVMVIVVGSRFYIRLRILRKFGVDDMALAATQVRAPVNYPASFGWSTQRAEESNICSQFSTIGGVIGIGYGRYMVSRTQFRILMHQPMLTPL